MKISASLSVRCGATGALAGACLLAACVAPAAPKRPIVPPPKLSDVTIDQYATLEWQPATNFFKSPGPVRITLLDASTGQPTVLVADDAEGSPTGDIVVKGNLRIERPEGTLTGQGLTYHATTRTGIVGNANAVAAGLAVHGRRLELLPNQSLLARDASFTTCDKPNPDYHITARQIRVSPDGHVNARNVTFFLGRVRIISLPSLSKSFGHTVSNPIPTPGYSKENSLQIHLRNDVVSTAATLFNYDVTASVKRTPQGIVSYEHDIGAPSDSLAPPRARLETATLPLRGALEMNPALLAHPEQTADDPRRTSLFALVTSNTFVYNRHRTDLRVSRLPEAGINLRNMLNRAPLTTGMEGDPSSGSVFGRGFFSPALWLVNAEAALGYYQEGPTHAQAMRMGTRADATSPLFFVTRPLYVRYGGVLEMNAYGNGYAYGIVAPEAELDLLLKRNTLIGAAYRWQQDFGKTPFLWDRRDITHELRLRYGFLGAHWAYDLSVNYDLQRLRAYDTLIGVRRRFDCMEIGLQYQTRSQGINFILNLIPGSRRVVAH